MVYIFLIYYIVFLVSIREGPCTDIMKEVLNLQNSLEQVNTHIVLRSLTDKKNILQVAVVSCLC